MLLSRALPLSCLLAIEAYAQNAILSGTNSRTSTINLGDTLPTGTEITYLSYSSTVTVPNSSTSSGSMSMLSSSMGVGNTSRSSSTSMSSSPSVTLLVGGHRTTSSSSGNGTALTRNSIGTQTSSSAQPTNTQPCNNYPEFCERKYSNITYVAAHNSPFSRPGNAASNQQLDVTYQLNDGIRMLQFQTHYENSTLYLCHTSCSLLNVGTLESYFTTVTTWLQSHPYDVITILMGNSNLIDPGNYIAPVTNSGLINYIYTPPKIPMALSDWPTLSSFILSGKRVVMFLDYQANQTQVPWLLDEFSQLWETPFSPTNRAFPCTVQRPPKLDNKDAETRMYMANHNLNTKISLAGISLLVPNTVVLNETNAVSGFGSLGRMADNCTATWNRPPNFLLVDYYNIGNVNGSVFEVAASMNNVTYNRKCCGLVQSGAPAPMNWSLKTLMLAFLSAVIVANL